MRKRKISRSLKKVKKQTWDVFSIFIRTRDCLKTTGTIEYGLCFTCRKRYHFNDLQAGHFVAGRGNSVLFDELGVNAQCKRCNVFLHGDPLIYRRRLVELYGEGMVQMLEDKKYKTKRYSIAELDLLTIHYQEETKLCNNKGEHT